MNSSILEVVGLTKVFGGVSAVQNVSFAVTPGHITSLIGPNGAGKSTLLNMVSAIYRPTSGEVRWDDRAITRLSPHAIARRGIARTFQTVQLFGNMTSVENVMVGRHLHSRTTPLAAMARFGSVAREEREVRDSAMRYLTMLGLEGTADSLPGDLPFSRQRLLEVARALACEPRLLLLDEPASGLSATEKRELVDLIYRIRETGVTIFMVDHDMDLVMSISDDVIVLDHGVLIARGHPKIVQRLPEVIAAYLGEEPADA